MPQPRRVAHLHTGLDWGGGEFQVANLVRAMTAAGMKTTLWAGRRGSLMAYAIAQELPARALTGPWRWPLGHIPLGRRLARDGVDLLHCHDSRALSLGIRIRQQLGVPLVLSRRIASPLRENAWSRAKYSARHIDAVAAVSETVREVFCRGGFPGERVFVVPSGLDLAALDGLTRDESFRRSFGGGPIVAGIGKLAPKKNWPLLIRTAALVAAAGIDAHWLLVGDGPDRPALEALARDAGVASRVHFLGFRADAEGILKDCDLLFFPSIREGASVTVRQAMALGIPVVAVDAAGIVESLDGHGWLVSPDDVAGAARAVVEALTDSGKREAVCRDARQSARERFAFDRTLVGTLEVYATVLAARARGAGVEAPSSR
jgi:glycosyltransferase involved in cell wall biosynthesis